MNPNDRILTGVMLMIAFCVIAPLIDERMLIEIEATAKRRGG